MTNLSNSTATYSDSQAKIDRIKELTIPKFETYAERYLKIRDKKGQLISFRLNNVQKQVDQTIEKQLSTKKPLRFIVLKARQEGVSTYFEGRIFHRQANHPFRKAMIVGHDAEASTNLFGMFKTYYENLETVVKPAIEYSNEKKFSFAGLKSEIKVATAEAREKLGRSSTIQDLHCTEVAFWSNAKDAMLALLQVVPDEANTMVVVESTANGIGGWFYNTWQDAVNGENDYTPIFLSWFDLHEYTKPFETPSEKKKFRETLDEYEKDLIETHGLTLEQINWYRYTKRNKCNDDPDEMMQEYPSTPEEAFITSGRPVFDIPICYANLNKAPKPIAIGYLEPVYDNSKDYSTKVLKGKSTYYDLMEHIVEIKFVENSKGFISLYKENDANKFEKYRYASGWDVAEGLEQGDYSAGMILDRRDMDVLLSWHGHIDPDMLAEEQHKIQVWLKNKIYFGTEFNNHGLTTISNAWRLGVNQYYREEFNSGYDVGSTKLGFKTSAQTKPIIVNDLKEYIREGLYKDYDKEFWKETLIFVRNARGQMQAQGKDEDPAIKSFDDRIISRAITIRVHKWMPKYVYNPEAYDPIVQMMRDRKKKRQKPASVMSL